MNVELLPVQDEIRPRFKVFLLVTKGYIDMICDTFGPFSRRSSAKSMQHSQHDSTSELRVSALAKPQGLKFQESYHIIAELMSTPFARTLTHKLLRSIHCTGEKQ